jgi:uncharacterized membrane protein YbjE (DUF340 family)
MNDKYFDTILTMNTIVKLLLFLLFFCGCAVKYNNLAPSNVKLNDRNNKLLSLSSNVSKFEAKALATLVLSHSKVLAHQYKIVFSPNFHNFLINIGLKEKGYCYN